MSPGPTEIIIIAIVIFALFGYRKLPDAARSIGKSMRIFKSETKALREDPAPPGDLDAKAQAEYVRGPAETDAAYARGWAEAEADSARRQAEAAEVRATPPPVPSPAPAPSPSSETR